MTVVDVPRRVAARAVSAVSSAFAAQKPLKTNEVRHPTKNSLIPFILTIGIILADFRKVGQVFLDLFM